MIGVVLAAHGSIGPALLEAAESILGPLPDVRALSITAGADPESLRSQVQEAIHEVDHGAGVLVLCDMFGGTPANLCLGIDSTRIRVITGVNLPMLLKIATIRAAGTPLEDIAEEVAEHGRRHIVQATDRLRGRRSRSEAGLSADDEDTVHAHR